MEPISYSDERLEENLALWNRAHHPLPEEQISSWEVVKTGKKEQLNLRHLDLDYTIHSRQNIDVEVRQWVGLFDPNKTEWLIVYGVGLGYYYLGLESWLRGNPRRQVIFLEDDLSILYHFLKTDAATKLLKDSQSYLLYLPQGELHSAEFEQLIQKSLFRSLHIAALAAYQLKKERPFDHLKFLIEFYRGIQESSTSEYLTHGKVFFKNFYHNILMLDRTLDGTAFVNKFQGMPAIIVAAGPSLGKNIELLKTLKDRALIFAGGTAMNAMNAYGVTPHFGCGIDPFAFHYSRILSNTAFETPYFFRSRMNAQAVALLQGPALYLPGTTGYPIAQYVDDQFGYPPFSMDEGSNVINTSLSIAEKLGCNPILFVGLDLAYTDGLSYAPGITSHGILDPREQFVTKGKKDELILVKDIDGQPIYTLMKWLIESSWYSSFARHFPDLKLINCTEGGIGFAHISNLSLEEASQIYLKKTYDIEGHIASVLLSDAAAHAPTRQQTKELLSGIVKDFNAIVELMSAFQEKHPEIWAQKLPEPSEELMAFEEALKKEPAYEFLLKPFDAAYEKYMRTSESELKMEAGPSEVQEVVKGKFPYLAEIVLQNLRYIQYAIQRKLKWEAAKASVQDRPLDPQVFKSPEIAKGSSLRYYPTGELLSSVSYKDGMKHGKALTYATNGQLLSEKGFFEGKEDGMHQYYYKDGKLKSQIPYTKGALDGEVHLYYSNGALKRSSSYKMGKREGIDMLYYINGAPLLKAEYHEDQPIGTALMWHLEGPVSMEVSYLKPGVISEVKRWNAQGEEIEETESRLDYIDTAVVNSMQLQHSISHMTDGLKGLVDNLGRDFSEEFNDELKEDVALVESKMEELQQLSEKLFQASGMQGEGKEAIYKTPANEGQINALLQGITTPMQESMLKLQWQLRSMIQAVQEQEKKSQNDDRKSE